MKFTRASVVLILSLVLALAVASVVVFAATQTMNVPTGAGCPDDSNWTTMPCWNNGAGPVPTTGDDVVIDGAQTPANTNYDLGTGVQLRSITLNQANNSINITGGPIVLQSGAFITNNWDTGGPLGSLPGITLNGPATFTHATSFADRFLGFSGAITGTGPLTLTNNGTNDNFRITVASSYTGATTVGGTARVRLDVNGAVPTGSALTVNGSALFQGASTIGSLAGGGNVFMNGNNTLTVGGDNTSTDFSGVYQDSGGAAALTKTGTGTLALRGFNTYTGPTTVNAGTLLVDGHIHSPVTVNNGGTLAGNSTIDPFAVTVNSGGTLSPGDPTAPMSTGDLTLNSGSMLTVELNGDVVGTHDQVLVAGTVTLGGGALDVRLGFTPTVGDVFTIIDNDGSDPVVGSFMLLGEGATFCVGGTIFKISYVGGAGNDVTLTVIGADTTPPKITCPANITVTTPSAGGTGTVVTYPAPQASDNCSLMSVVCNPPSGSTFPIGTTTVTCTATDAAGNMSSCSFTVGTFDVCLQDDSLSSTVLIWNSLTGDYIFCCGGTKYSGKGIVAQRGSIFTLTDFSGNRRVSASVDASQNRGSASLQSPPGVTRCSITDRDTRNNSCQCAG